MWQVGRRTATSVDLDPPPERERERERERETHAHTYMAKDTLDEARMLLPPPLLRSPMPFFDMVHSLTSLRVSKLTGRFRGSTKVACLPLQSADPLASPTPRSVLPRESRRFKGVVLNREI